MCFDFEHIFLFTGELDDKTLNVMTLPRCGVKDKVGTGDNRAKRYALQGKLTEQKILSRRVFDTF